MKTEKPSKNRKRENLLLILLATSLTSTPVTVYKIFSSFEPVRQIYDVSRDPIATEAMPYSPDQIGRTGFRFADDTGVYSNYQIGREEVEEYFRENPQ